MARVELLHETFTATSVGLDTWMAANHPGWTAWNANADDRMQIASNAVGTIATTNDVYKIDTLTAADQYVGIRPVSWSAFSAAAAWIGVRLTGAAGTRSGVIAEIVENGASLAYCHVAKYVGGSVTDDQFPAGFGTFVVGTDYFFAEAVGSDLLLYINSTLVATLSGYLSAHTSGSVGFGLRASSGQIVIDDLKFGSFGSAGTPAGLATETDTALALAAKQIKATGLATETDTALALTTSAGFDFHSAAGLVFGDLAGALTSLAREASVSMVLRVYAVASPGALVVESGTLTTDSNGRLARYTHASLAAATSYICVFIRSSDGEVACAKLTAT